MKKTGIKTLLLDFLFGFIFTFFFVYSLIHCISNFFDINNQLCLFISLVAGLIVAIIYSVWSNQNAKTLHESKISFWFKANSPKLILSYFIILFSLISITDKAIWSEEEIVDVLSLEWTIFGLSVTIFLVWNVIYIEYLKKIQPKKPDTDDYLEKYEFLGQKQSFYRQVENSFTSIILLSINLFLLLFSSSFVHVSRMKEAVFTQNLVLCTFYFSTNTIALLFFDLLKPLKKDRDAFRKANQVTKEERDSALERALLQKLADDHIIAICNSPDLTQEQKDALLESMAKAINNPIEKKADKN